jgi:hypothetical protein
MLFAFAVAAVGGIIAASSALGPERTSAPHAREERPGSLQQQLKSVPDMRRLLNGAPRITGCKDRGRDRLCRVEGPTGSRAMCVFSKRTTDASCFEVRDSETSETTQGRLSGPRG